MALFYMVENALLSLLKNHTLQPNAQWAIIRSNTQCLRTYCSGNLKGDIKPFFAMGRSRDGYLYEITLKAV